MVNDKILKRILNLLERNEKNGATRSEAETALKLANRLMTEYNITEFDLNKVDRSSFVDKPFNMSRLDVVNLFQKLAEAFDCESYYYKLKKEFHFFGFNLDVKLCLHFAQMLQDCLELEIKNFKKSEKYKELVSIYQPKIIIKNIIKGFSYSLYERFEGMRQEKIVISSGTSLMVIKTQQVKNEFQRLYNNIKISKNSDWHLIKSAFMYGEDCADKVQFNKPVEKLQDDYIRIGILKGV